MLIVLTHEQSIVNESDIVNALFQLGLERLHLRKPNSSKEECRALIQQIDTQFYDRIMLHQYHELAEEFSCCGIHLKEAQRKELSKRLPEYISDFQQKKLKVSTGFHTTNELMEHTSLFDYLFLSPVFNSISKQGYIGKEESISHLNQHNVMALGGIHSENINKVAQLGYNGAAVLGSVWNSSDPIDAFKTLKTVYLN